MFESSRLQGLHQLAKKLMIKGLPSLLRVAVSMVFPSMGGRLTEGIGAKALAAESLNSEMADEGNFFMVGVVCKGVKDGFCQSLGKNRVEDFLGKSLCKWCFQ